MRFLIYFIIVSGQGPILLLADPPPHVPRVGRYPDAPTKKVLADSLISLLFSGSEVPQTLDALAKRFSKNFKRFDGIVPISDAPGHTNLQEPRYLYVSSDGDLAVGVIPRQYGTYDMEFISRNTRSGHKDFGIVEDFGTNDPILKLAPVNNCFECHKNRDMVTLPFPWANSLGGVGRESEALSMVFLKSLSEKDKTYEPLYKRYLAKHAEHNPPDKSIPRGSITPADFAGLPLKTRILNGMDLAVVLSANSFAGIERASLSSGRETALHAFVRKQTDSELRQAMIKEIVKGALDAHKPNLSLFREHLPETRPGLGNGLREQPFFPVPAALIAELDEAPQIALRLEKYFKEMKKGAAHFPKAMSMSRRDGLIEGNNIVDSTSKSLAERITDPFWLYGRRSDGVGGSAHMAHLIANERGFEEFELSHIERLAVQLFEREQGLKATDPKTPNDVLITFDKLLPDRLLKTRSFKNALATRQLPLGRDFPLIVQQGLAELLGMKTSDGKVRFVQPEGLSKMDTKGSCLACHGPNSGPLQIPFDPFDTGDWMRRLKDPSKEIRENAEYWLTATRERVENKEMPPPSVHSQFSEDDMKKLRLFLERRK